MSLVPIVIEKDGRGERAYDIYSRLLRERIVFLGTAIDDVITNLIIAQILFLESEDPSKEIYLYINSPGGIITSGLAIYDTMQYVKAPIVTTCIGQAASMGAAMVDADTPAARVDADVYLRRRNALITNLRQTPRVASRRQCMGSFASIAITSRYDSFRSSK